MKLSRTMQDTSQGYSTRAKRQQATLLFFPLMGLCRHFQQNSFLGTSALPQRTLSSCCTVISGESALRSIIYSYANLVFHPCGAVNEDSSADYRRFMFILSILCHLGCGDAQFLKQPFCTNGANAHIDNTLMITRKSEIAKFWWYALPHDNVIGQIFCTLKTSSRTSNPVYNFAISCSPYRKVIASSSE